MTNKVPPHGERYTHNWSIEFDSKNILALCAVRPKMSYAELLIVIRAEGGYVDSNGIVHKGTATDKLWSD
jgi:hypothetical protein